MHNQSQGELYPLNLEFALLVCRFGNAEASTRGESSFRYQLNANIHEPLDPESDLSVWDEVDETWCTVSDVYGRLSSSNRYWVDYQSRTLIRKHYGR
ncbi:TPA_asm: hypothetical protein [ssRNA phage Gephyllon.3_13]|uniref:Uncharacterized protein n=1 Tax=ssRNA phage Gephyllon.3_13 TaxID=2786153 RepID=A0A8S5KZH9_9VIRU|nr:hypothetical protein QIO65_gp4 [ssRNA phage Gephyllon.3_13]DAD50583.1 TPA_asm: hypothetical protein [ssRNA phage Gephyllon.3_13]